jgi:hypothetical protein
MESVRYQKILQRYRLFKLPLLHTFTAFLLVAALFAEKRASKERVHKLWHEKSVPSLKVPEGIAQVFDVTTGGIQKTGGTPHSVDVHHHGLRQ